MSNNESITLLRQKIEHVRIGMLTTISSDRTLVSRPMTNQKIDDDGLLWFYVSDESAVSQQIEAQPNVNVSFTAPEDSLYVSVAGSAELIKDRSLIHSMWNPIVAAWFPNGPDDPHVALIKVEMHSAEYWDSKLSKMTQLMKMMKAAVTGKPPTDISEHKKIAL
ncbi:MAG: pyridoxamine 5'-phosphate oxidase family protein [Pseudomonadota bacterium]